jgi:hypothetical protein
LQAALSSVVRLNITTPVPSAAVKAYKSTALIRCDLKDDYRGTSIPFSDCTVPIKRRCSHIQRRVFSLDPQRNRWRRDCATPTPRRSQNEEGGRPGLQLVGICRRYRILRYCLFLCWCRHCQVAELGILLWRHFNGGGHFG